MRKLIYCLSLILVASSFASAQDVLIKHNGDSLVGKLSFAKDALGVEYASIKVGRKRQQVKLFDIRMIRTQKGETVKPIEYSGNYKFGKEMASGYLSYYRISGDDTREMFTQDLLTKMDGTFLILSGSIAFRGPVSRFLEDCYEVSYAVKQRKYSRSKLTELVADYNSCVSQNGLMSEDAIEQRAEQLLIEKQKESEKAISKGLEEKLADFSTLLEYSDKIGSKTDVTAMFNDVAGKLRRGETVPQYLKTALEDAIKKDPQLKKLLAEILTNGKN